MNKQELVSALMQKNPKDFASKAAAQRAVNGVFELIRDAVANGENVSIIGFGSFAASERKARAGRNPKTGEMIEIPASRGVSFKAGADFKKAVRG